jgi:hypothetical protein
VVAKVFACFIFIILFAGRGFALSFQEIANKVSVSEKKYFEKNKSYTYDLSKLAFNDEFGTKTMPNKLFFQITSPVSCSKNEGVGKDKILTNLTPELIKELSKQEASRTYIFLKLIKGVTADGTDIKCPLTKEDFLLYAFFLQNDDIDFYTIRSNGSHLTKKFKATDFLKK